MEKVSVRNLVEFILREGDIEPQGTAVPDAEAMQQGIRIHKILQKRRGAAYIPEVPLSVERTICNADLPEYILKIEGRADGIETAETIIIHEIKSMYADVSKFTEAKNLHLAQAKCYAAMYLETETGAAAGEESAPADDTITIEITYCQIESMITKDFRHTYDKTVIIQWFNDLVDRYAKWVTWKLIHRQKRNESMKGMEFPFEYRKGQFELVKGVYISILHKKNLFLQAPTGVGKTMSTVFPAVCSMGEGLTDKIFYLTAKTITRTVAEEAFSILGETGLDACVITLTAKDKICIFDKADCDPAKCPRAKGHYDRINDAIYDMICSEKSFTREKICEYAKKHNVCPFEMSLDVALWSDVIICDYNYVFDPKVSLRRFFAENDKKDYVFLVDEAHNLVDRARNMYSASLNRSLVMSVKKSLKQSMNQSGNATAKSYKALERISKIMLEYKRLCNEFLLIDSLGTLIYAVMNAVVQVEEFIKEEMPKNRAFAAKEDLLELYFSMRFFLEIHSLIDDKYKIYADYNESGEFRITLSCMDPSENLKKVHGNIRSAIFFSATLIPVKYYMEQFGAGKDDYTIYAETSFKNEQRLVLAANDVSAKYSRRNEDEYRKIAAYIEKFVSAKKGNYIVYFPSYKMMDNIINYLIPADNAQENAGEVQYLIQRKNMSEAEREEFLAEFLVSSVKTKIGMCVMGGVFAEGIDLKEDRLIGTVIVGTGLPMVGYERELFRSYYDEKKNSGFEYAYLYPGMNKVLQAGGRVIRTINDRGVILLLDDRYTTRQYNSLFPREWSHYRYVNIDDMNKYLKEFWDA